MSKSVSLVTTTLMLSLFGTPAIANDGIEFFEKKIRPVLVESCYRCHSSDTKRLKGGLRLDTRPATLEGGDTGPSVVPGKPEESLLIKAMLYEDEDLQMPPKGKLPANVLADFVAWVKMGAPDPRDRAPTPASKPATIDFDKARTFWAFQPPAEPEIPRVHDSGWCASPLDRFVLARLEAAGLAPAPTASKRTLIRRATYNLTGLPPTPEETDAFLSDSSANAYEKVLDRLLSSPHYGEKWGRHWLDVARYADSNGVDENLAYIQAFRYRDYVIDAFAKDKPYDRFVQEQLAGDLLPASRNESETEHHERLIATGFLSLGPKMLACDDGQKMELDIIDEQIDTTSRAFMGMTMGCARCHDHKFDPLPTADYYALAGIFKSTKTMENFDVVAQWHEYTVATKAERAEAKAHENKLTAVTAKRDAHERRAQEALLKAERLKAIDYLIAAAKFGDDPAPPIPDGKTTIGDLVDTANLPSGYVLLEAEDFQQGTVGVDTEEHGRGIGVTKGSGSADYEFELPEAGEYQLELRYASKGGRTMSIHINDKFITADGVKVASRGMGPEHQHWHVEGVFEFQAGTNVLSLARVRPWPSIDKILIAKMPDETKGDVPGRQTAVDDLAKSHGLKVSFLRQWVEFLTRTRVTEGSVWEAWSQAPQAADSAVASRNELTERYRDAFAAAHADGGSSQTAESEPFRTALYSEAGPYRLPLKPNGDYDKASQEELAELDKERQSLEESKPKLALAMGVREGEIKNLPVHIRGSYLNLAAEEEARAFPRILTPRDEQETIDETTSGRRQLARWLTRDDHPLTARVMMNRIWLWHFSEGLVRSPDNFGRLGERPTHPALLDWLARRFVESRWSIKAMHRLIMTSATYRMSTEYNEAAANDDPENRLWWRFNRRRLEAEEVRDSLLAVSQRLESTFYGQLLPVKARAYVAGIGPGQGQHYNNTRRSVYVPVLRSAVYPLFITFDFADPGVISGKRQSTTIAPQALFMMNGKLVLQESRVLAEEILANADLDDAGRVRLIYRRLLGRPITGDETNRGVEFVRRYTQSLDGEELEGAELNLRAWQGLCRVILASNEFIYVE